MAMKKTATTIEPWDNPIWPDALPDAADMRVVYGAFADELVIRFTDDRYHDIVVVVPVTTPKQDYAGMLVAADTGAVLGVHVYPLAAYAAMQHPAWMQVGHPDPEPAAVMALVEDIKRLFERYGIQDSIDSNLD
jgi:hypothetical protein